ncbi:hypothetical protein LCGC14_0971160 [marine sediment metagenome]|uniref:Uncharacterized protein n=1 Tax=marine sediment metagenome TaxID=412755 RepID=A0A0F9QUU1_9ZZZZ
MPSGKDIQRALGKIRKAGAAGIKPRKRGKGVLARLSSGPKKGRAGSALRSYFG